MTFEPNQEVNLEFLIVVDKDGSFGGREGDFKKAWSIVRC